MFSPPPTCHSGYSPLLAALPRFLSPNYVQIVQINTFPVPLSRKWCGISSGGVLRLLSLHTFNVITAHYCTGYLYYCHYCLRSRPTYINVVWPSVVSSTCSKRCYEAKKGTSIYFERKNTNCSQGISICGRRLEEF